MKRLWIPSNDSPGELTSSDEHISPGRRPVSANTELDIGLAALVELYGTSAVAVQTADVSNEVVILCSGGVTSLSLRTFEKGFRFFVTEWSNVGISGTTMDQQGILDRLERPFSAFHSSDFCVSELQCQRGGLGPPRTYSRSESLIEYAAKRSLRLLS